MELCSLPCWVYLKGGERLCMSMASVASIGVALLTPATSHHMGFTFRRRQTIRSHRSGMGGGTQQRDE